MADIEINGITREKTTLDGTEKFEGQDVAGGAGSSFKATLSNMVAAIKALSVNTIDIAQNIRFAVANGVEDEGLFLRIGADGWLSTYRAPDQDAHWEDTDNTSIALTTTGNPVLSVTPDQDVLTSDGSYEISGKLDNTTGQEKTVTLAVKDDGVPGETTTIILAKNELGKTFIFSGGVVSTIASGSVMTIEFSANNTGVNLRGDSLVTKLVLTKAQAAPVALSSITSLNPEPSEAIAGDEILLRDSTNETLVKSSLSNMFNFFNTALGTVGTGRKIGRTSPTFGYRDWEGTFRPDPSGGDSPTTVNYCLNTRLPVYSTGDKFDIDIHVPHDCVPGTPLYFHPHILLNGTGASGNVTLQIGICHVLGDGRGAETPQASISKTVVYPVDGLVLQQSAVIDTEFMVSGGGVGLLDSDMILPDDNMVFSCEVTGTPTVTGGNNASFIPNFDIHAQTTGELGTKGRAGNFYV